MKQITGIGASDGYAVGTAFCYHRPAIEIDRTPVAFDERQSQIDLFMQVRQRVYYQLKEIADSAEAKFGVDNAKIFHCHIQLLLDEELKKSVIDLLYKGESLTAAILDAVTIYSQQMQAVDDEYIRERAVDIEDIGNRLLCEAAGEKYISLSQIPKNSIIIAEQLMPSDTVSINFEWVKGIVIEKGSKTCHTAILARSVGIPAIVVCPGAPAMIEDGMQIAIDGRRGEVVISPDEQTKNRFLVYLKRYQAHLQSLKQASATLSRTLDGHPVDICANISDEKELEVVFPFHPDGIGLVRTEFLFMKKRVMPNFEQQLGIYQSIFEKAQGMPVWIRTADFGGDKPVGFLNFESEDNPFLGKRGIRLSLAHPELLVTQLKAIFAAAVGHNVSFMYPMIACMEELDAAIALEEQAVTALQQEGIEYMKPKRGIIIETPGAAMMVDCFAPKVDFVSIGSNDLIQYALAADRLNTGVAQLYQPFHPGVLRMIKLVIDQCKKAKITVGMCGELASIPEAAILLLGLGLEEFSMSAQSMPVIKNIITKSHLGFAKRVAEYVLTLPSAQEVYTYLGEQTRKISFV